jgi:ribonuclease BN (tRNA processing enzyme)
VRITLWGTRGSVARAGRGTVRYGGDTACVQVNDADGRVVILDGGSGLLHCTNRLGEGTVRVDILLTHLHMDHIQGLGFFYPLRSPDVETHIWGPATRAAPLSDRLARYLSPPLFPVRLRDLAANHIHDVLPGTFTVGSFAVTADYVCHPGPTLGFRLVEKGKTLVYLPDHEPALGHRSFPGDPTWTSGADLARDADVLIHDTQYTDDEYVRRVGWGHSTLAHAVGFARQSGVRELVTFHHDPEHGDDLLDELHRAAGEGAGSVRITPGLGGEGFDL